MQQITEHVNDTGLLFGFSSNTLVIKEEDYLYPPESFLAEIGGSLGLFLGFSILGLWDIFNLLLKGICRNKSENLPST